MRCTSAPRSRATPPTRSRREPAPKTDAPQAVKTSAAPRRGRRRSLEGLIAPRVRRRGGAPASCCTSGSRAAPATTVTPSASAAASCAHTQNDDDGGEGRDAQSRPRRRCAACARSKARARTSAVWVAPTDGNESEMRAARSRRRPARISARTAPVPVEAGSCGGAARRAPVVHRCEERASREGGTSLRMRTLRTTAPIARSAARCRSTGRAPMAHPPGSAALLAPARHSSGAKSRKPARSDRICETTRRRR